MQLRFYSYFILINHFTLFYLIMQSSIYIFPFLHKINFNLYIYYIIDIFSFSSLL